MKNVLKITIIFITIFMILCQFGCVFAEVNPDEYDPHPEQLGTSGKFLSKIRIIVGAIQAIGIILSVVALIIIGIKEMFGSLEERSKIKAAIPVYVLGMIMVVAITSIPSLIYNFAVKIK